MRFKRFGVFEFEDTPRKRAALERKQRAERESLPLFADQVASEQPAVDEVMAARALHWNTRQSEDRKERAAHWRKARRRLRQYPDTVRAELLAYWQRCKWPADPSYLLTMLHMHDNGRLDMHPVYLSAAELASAKRQGPTQTSPSVLAGS